MRIQSVQNNNHNTNFRSLILDKNLKPFLNQLSKRDLLEIREISEKLKDTKYYDLKVYQYITKQSWDPSSWIEPSFIPKTTSGKKVVGRINPYEIFVLKGPNGYETKLNWRDANKTSIVLDFKSSTDALIAKEITNDADVDVYTDGRSDSERYGISNLLPAIRAWADVCTDVFEKSMAFKESGKPTVLTESERLIEELISPPKDEINYETINVLRNYLKSNPDYGNLYTAEDMLELLKDMLVENVLHTKNILTAPIKEGDSSILMYIADIPRTEENAKKYDKILKILSRLQGINYNHKDEMGISFLEKVMMSENEKLLDLIKNERLEYYPELDYAYENIQNPEFKEKIKELNIILKNTDGLTASDIKSELQSIAFQNTVNRKV